MLQHIALEVKKDDIQDFYIDILGGIVSKQFSLDENTIEELFNIQKTIDVYRLKMNNLDFELFVHDSIDIETICHICLEVPDSQSISNRAKEKGYWFRARKSNNGETYFIRDKNRNMFELKNKQ